MAHGHQHEPEQGIEHEDFAGKEAGVDEAEPEEEHEAPHVAVAEILSALLAVMALQIERETEEEGEDGIRLSGEKEKQKVPQMTVQVGQQGRSGFGERVEVEVLDVVQQHDAHHGEAAERVDGQYTSVCG